MKKAIFILLALFITTQALFSCKKSDDSTNSVIQNQWRVNDSVFTATQSYHSTNPIYSLAFLDIKNGSSYWNGLVFTFNGSATPASGKYKMTNKFTGTANEVSVLAYKYYEQNGFIFDPKNYVAVTADSPLVTVTANGDKLTVSLPEVWAVRSESPHDSVRISAQLLHGQ